LRDQFTHIGILGIWQHCSSVGSIPTILKLPQNPFFCRHFQFGNLGDGESSFRVFWDLRNGLSGSNLRLATKTVWWWWRKMAHLKNWQHFVSLPSVHRQTFLGVYFWSATPCASLPFFWFFFFCVHHHVNRDDRHLLSQTMFFLFRIKLHAQTHRPDTFTGTFFFAAKHYRINGPWIRVVNLTGAIIYIMSRVGHHCENDAEVRVRIQKPVVTYDLGEFSLQ
jgi:hypothetical protein